MRTERFTFLCTPDERAALEHLSRLWRRSKSDTVRLLIAAALEELFAAEEGASSIPPNGSAVRHSEPRMGDSEGQR